jgi:4-carboxymuconolactone decarboxylase
MPDAPTFGRYAEIPSDRMTPEQQEGYRTLIETRGQWAGRTGSGCATPSWPR